MKIGIIGTGNVGGALAAQWAAKDHEIILGVRDLNNFKGKHLLELGNVELCLLSELVAKCEVILIAAAPQFTQSILNEIGDVGNMVIIDAMNAVRTRPEGFNNSFEAIKHYAPNAEVAKCFNSTGFENMKNPEYTSGGIDMFVAGTSETAKEIAIQLSQDAGFAECYDFGGDDKVALLEQFAFAWINLAIMQGHGRDIAFKVVKREE